MQSRLIVGLATVAVAVLAWVWQTNYSKLLEIDANLQEVKTQLAVLSQTALTEDAVRKIVEHELLLRGIK